MYKPNRSKEDYFTDNNIGKRKPPIEFYQMLPGYVGIEKVLISNLQGTFNGS